MLPAISKRALPKVVLALCLGAVAIACARTVATHDDKPASGPVPVLPAAQGQPSSRLPAPPPSMAPGSGLAAPDGGAGVVAAGALPLSSRTDGAQSVLLTPDRPILYARPLPARAAGASPWRLVGHLHGICHPPSYSCGKWLGAAIDVGVLVCPTGNARCGDAGVGPPSWEAATWEELVRAMDGDLERSIAKVEAKHPGSIRREGAVLTGWSRGAFAAPVIARAHPGRWPYLVLIEANVPLSAASLRKAGVRAVALLAGEKGTEIAGERKTQEALEAAGFPARLFVMEGVAHQYPDDMDRLMADALAYVLSVPSP